MKQRLYWRNNLQDLTLRKKGLVSKCVISNCGSKHGIDNILASVKLFENPL